MTDMTHAERAVELLQELAGHGSQTDEVLAQMAVAHSMLAVADAIYSWQPPTDTAPEIPFEQTKAGWRW